MKAVFIKLIGDPLYQWDSDRWIEVLTSHDEVDEIHVSSAQSANAYVLEPTAEGERLTAPIPNLLLQRGEEIKVFAVLRTENGRRTTKEYTFGVKPRAKPDDYVYTETEVRSYYALDQRIKELEDREIDTSGLVTKDELAEALKKVPRCANVHSGPEPPTDGSNLWINPNEDDDEEDDDYPGGSVDLSGYATEEYVNKAIANLPESIEPPSTASVGQTIVVKAVDDNNKPTEWEAVDLPSDGGSGGSASTFSLTLTTDEARKAVEIPLPVDLYDTLIFNIHATFPNVETAFNLYLMVTYGVNDVYQSLITIPASAQTGFNMYAVKHYAEFHAYSVAAAANYPNNARPANTSNGIRIHKDSRKITLYSNTDGVLIPEGSTFEMWGVCRQ